MPRFEPLTPIKTDTTPGITLDTRTRDEHFAQVFTGYLYVRARGIYRFELISDDGARFFIADRLVVDNDGLHGSVAVLGHLNYIDVWSRERHEVMLASQALTDEDRRNLADFGL